MREIIMIIMVCVLAYLLVVQIAQNWELVFRDKLKGDGHGKKM